MQLLEENGRKTKENNYEFMKTMDRCAMVRDEQINAQRSEIEKKDQMIAEMKVKIVASETKIDELLNKMKTLEENTNIDSLRVAKGTPDTAVVIERTGSKTGTKPKRKTRWVPLTCPNTSPLMEEPFVKFCVESSSTLQPFPAASKEYIGLSFMQ